MFSKSNNGFRFRARTISFTWLLFCFLFRPARAAPKMPAPQHSFMQKTRFHGTKCLLGVAKPQFNIFDFDAPMWKTVHRRRSTFGKGNETVACTNRRNQPMGPVGRVPSNFGDHGDQVYLVPSNFCIWLSFWCWAIWEAYSAPPDTNFCTDLWR